MPIETGIFGKFGYLFNLDFLEGQIHTLVSAW
jgi:hypothetical protein